LLFLLLSIETTYHGAERLGMLFS